MDTSPEPADLHEEADTTPAGCPNDTDGDGNCGSPACPHCGKYRLGTNSIVLIEPSRDVDDTPQPQRDFDTY
jgi:hypothetical protein